MARPESLHPVGMWVEVHANPIAQKGQRQRCLSHIYDDSDRNFNTSLSQIAGMAHSMGALFQEVGELFEGHPSQLQEVKHFSRR
jgi:hypothetical protein